jgi:muramoyltetrapeptide carboxypeptidase
MKRRQFNQQIGLAGLLSATPLLTSIARPPKKKLIKPKRLKKGDTIGMISPGSHISDEELEKAVIRMEELGFQVKLSKNVSAKRGFNAGTDEQRLNDLHSMFSDKQVDGIWCTRGGYGCSRLLPKINYNLIKRNPKVLIGYSDITALNQGIFQKTGMVCFHGPVGASELTEYNKQHITNILLEPKEKYSILLSEENLQTESDHYKIEVIRPGKMKGPLIGGNLSLLAALAGTPYNFDAKGKIVFIEDVGEKPYRIDRMLTTIRQACNLKAASGIILGIFEDCQPGENDLSLSLMETLRDRLRDLDVPVIYGLSFGHIMNQCIFPLGVKAELDTGQQSINLLEAAVV